MLFPIMSKPRELNEEEIKKYELRYYNSDEVAQPAIETTAVVWSAAMTETDPVYRLYAHRTNCLLVLKYDWGKDSWDRIEFEEIHNLYGLLWLMCLRISSLKDKENQDAL